MCASYQSLRVIARAHRPAGPVYGRTLSTGANAYSPPATSTADSGPPSRNAGPPEIDAVDHVQDLAFSSTPRAPDNVAATVDGSQQYTAVLFSFIESFFLAALNYAYEIGQHGHQLLQSHRPPGGGPVSPFAHIRAWKKSWVNASMSTNHSGWMYKRYGICVCNDLGRYLLSVVCSNQACADGR